MKLDKIFVYERNKKVSSIEYKEFKDENKIIYVYRDLSQNAIDKADYIKNINENPGKYTMENYNKIKDFFGVIVLQTNSDKPADEIFKLYKKRWKIETYYDYFKNGVNFKTLQLNDYYMTQGLSFVMLIVGLIHKAVNDKLNKADIKKSIDDCILKTRFLKTIKTGDVWYIANCKSELKEFYAKLNIDLPKNL